MGRLDIRDNLRDDERRQRDEARLETLQEHVEELRLSLKESVSRHAKAEESHRALEEVVVRLDSRLDAVRAEGQGFNGARHVEEGRLRALVEELDGRIVAAAQALPTFQARLAELTKETRDRFQELGQDRHRFSDLQAQIERLPPQVERSVEIARGVRDELAAVRAAIDAIRGEGRKTSDAVGIVEQDVRRRVGDVLARLEETQARIEAVKEELSPLDLQIDRVRHELHQALPKFDALAAADAALKEEVDRAAALDFDRHVQALARADEARGAIEERVRLIERLNDTRFGSTMARFSELEEADRGLGHRITLLAVRLEELREQDAAIRDEIRRLEEWRVRVRLEQAQQEANTFRQHLADLGLLGAKDEDDGDA